MWETISNVSDNDATDFKTNEGDKRNLESTASPIASAAGANLPKIDAVFESTEKEQSSPLLHDATRNILNTRNTERVESGRQSIESSTVEDEVCEVLPESTDVVIIGAGPAGLTLACELARRGISFLIFDINARPVAQSRGLMLHERTLEIMADLGLTEPAVLSGHIVRGSNVFVNDKLVLDLKFTGAVQGPFPFTLVLEQSQTECMLIERLIQLGHRVHRPVAVWRVEVPEAKDAVNLSEGCLNHSPASISMMLAARSALAGTTGGQQIQQSGASTPNTSGLLVNGSHLSTLNNATATIKSLSSFLNESYCTVHVKALDIYGRPRECPVGQVGETPSTGGIARVYHCSAVIVIIRVVIYFSIDVFV